MAISGGSGAPGSACGILVGNPEPFQMYSISRLRLSATSDIVWMAISFSASTPTTGCGWTLYAIGV
ncbi:hypothetical protein [Streptomyces sp. NPDC004675]|uniref:hypothetical protein n=1 Tax=Streptomyces sp. NPDC004675 TaxID=3154286 RepID=UPI0033A06070